MLLGLPLGDQAAQAVGARSDELIAQRVAGGRHAAVIDRALGMQGGQRRVEARGVDVRPVTDLAQIRGRVRRSGMQEQPRRTGLQVDAGVARGIGDERQRPLAADQARSAHA